jgi:hypothetical protein
MIIIVEIVRETRAEKSTGADVLAHANAADRLQRGV